MLSNYVRVCCSFGLGLIETKTQTLADCGGFVRDTEEGREGQTSDGNSFAKHNPKPSSRNP